MKDELSQQEQLMQDWLMFAEESFIGENFNLNNSKGFMSSRLDKNTIDALLKQPYTNYKQLQEYSRLFMTKEGIYYRLIKSLANMLTYDHLIFPNIQPYLGNKYKKDIKEAYGKASLYLEKLNIKYNAPIFAEDLLRDGECYYYKIENPTGIIYQKIDNKYCLPYKSENNVLRFVVDCSLLLSYDDITVLPIEIQKALVLYKQNKEDSNLFILNRYYPVQNGICFSTLLEGKHAIPPFSFLFPDLISLDNKKVLKDKTDLVNNTKMIHNKIESKDKETMVDPSVARKYNEAIKKNLIQKNLEEGIFSITNPFDASILNLDTSSARTENMVRNSISQVFSEIGVSEMLFNSEKGGAEALKKSVVNDATLCINMILTRINAYVNEELRLIPTNVKMLCKILDTTYFDREDRKKVAREDLAYGGSRSLYLATTGFTPLEGINILNMEKLLNIDSYFVPAQTSHTLSNKDSSNAGAPSTEEIQNNGGEVAESTQQVNETK